MELENSEGRKITSYVIENLAGTNNLIHIFIFYP